MSQAINTNTNIQSSWDANAMYSANAQGGVEQKGFFGKIWSGLQSLTESGRTSIAHENQKVLVALFNDMGLTTGAGLDAESFYNLADQSVRSGDRAIRGSDLAAIRDQVQARVADNASAAKLNQVTQAVLSAIPGHGPAYVPGQEPYQVADGSGPHILAGVINNVPRDQVLAQDEAGRIGGAIAEKLAGVISNGGQVNQDLVGLYLSELDRGETQNVFMAMQKGCVTASGVGATTVADKKQVDTVQQNAGALFTAIRSHLEAMRAAAFPGLAGGAGGINAQANNTGAGAPLDEDTTDFMLGLMFGTPKSGSVPPEVLATHSDTLLGAQALVNNLGLSNQASLDGLGDSFRGYFSEKCKDVDNFAKEGSSLFRGNEPLILVTRKIAQVSVAPFLEVLERAGAETMLDEDGTVYTLADLTRLTAEMKKECKDARLPVPDTLKGTQLKLKDISRHCLDAMIGAFNGVFGPGDDIADERYKASKNMDTMNWMLGGLGATMVDALTSYMSDLDQTRSRLNNDDSPAGQAALADFTKKFGALDGAKAMTETLKKFGMNLMLGQVSASTARYGVDSFYSNVYHTFLTSGMNTDPPDIFVMNFLEKIAGSDIFGARRNNDFYFDPRQTHFNFETAWPKPPAAAPANGPAAASANN